MPITDIIMYFDGTCTEIPAIYEAFLAQYLMELNRTVFAQSLVRADEWREAQELVRTHSPRAAWTIASTPAAPAAADPYIFSFECAKFLLRKKNIQAEIPPEVFKNAANSNPAPWRKEAREVFETLLNHNIGITFISNTSSTAIIGRLQELFSVIEIPKGIAVKSGAEKYRITELVWDSTIPRDTQKSFQHLPAVHSETSIDRPVYLRRGSYFEAICAAFRNDLGRLASSVFCGDIWEMDLAMPHVLGANIHLIERADPFTTYEYERKAVIGYKRRYKISKDLTSLLE